jgi:hypothetical protein
MSQFNDIDLECSNCGHEHRASVWVAIHAGQDPELKDLLLGGELNLVSCPECMHVSFEDRFLIYQEPAAELVAYVYPEIQRAQEAELQILMLKGFHEAQATLPEKQHLDYDPLLFFGLESLIEQLNEEQALAVQSQVAQALCKQHKLKSILLRPHQARQLGTMRVLPIAGEGTKPARKEILAGIEKLLEIDPVLDLYTKLKEKIKSDPAWSL